MFSHSGKASERGPNLAPALADQVLRDGDNTASVDRSVDGKRLPQIKSVPLYMDRYCQTWAHPRAAMQRRPCHLENGMSL